MGQGSCSMMVETGGPFMKVQIVTTMLFKHDHFLSNGSEVYWHNPNNGAAIEGRAVTFDENTGIYRIISLVQNVELKNIEEQNKVKEMYDELPGLLDYFPLDTLSGPNIDDYDF